MTFNLSFVALSSDSDFILLEAYLFSFCPFKNRHVCYISCQQVCYPNISSQGQMSKIISINVPFFQFCNEDVKQQIHELEHSSYEFSTGRPEIILPIKLEIYFRLK